MTSLPKTITAIAVAGTLIAGQAVGLASQASAGDWRHRDGVRHSAPASRHYEPRRIYGHGSHRLEHRGPVHRDRSGDAVAGAILGIGALIVGAAIADAHRKQRQHDDD